MNGTRDRGCCWEQIAQSLKAIEHPKYNVYVRGVRDRFTKLEKNYRKMASEEHASGISGDEQDEFDQALEEILQLMNEEQWEAGEKRKEVEKEKETSASVRKRAMERLAEKRAREGVERVGRKGRCGTEAVEYLKERGEHDDKLTGEEKELRKGNQFQGEVRGRREKNEEKRTIYEGERAIQEGKRIEPQKPVKEVKA